MTIYSPKKFQQLYNYKEAIEDEEIKGIITELIKNYNYMYIKLKDFLQEKQDKKENYNKLDKLSRENKELKERVERDKLLIADLRRKIKEVQKIDKSRFKKL